MKRERPIGIIKARHLAVSASESAARSDSRANSSAEPRGDRCDRPAEIVVHRTDARVDAIEITCPCGHTMIVECDYDDEAPQ